LMFAGVFEKILKAKKQQQAPPPSQSYDDFEDVEAQTSTTQAPPQTLEEMMRRMMQTVETPTQMEEKVVFQPQPAQSLEELPSAGRYFHHPEEVKKREQSGRIAYKPITVVLEEEKIETAHIPEFHFDIRQAIIASEILNRKY